MKILIIFKKTFLFVSYFPIYILSSFAFEHANQIYSKKMCMTME